MTFSSHIWGAGAGRCLKRAFRGQFVIKVYAIYVTKCSDTFVEKMWAHVFRTKNISVFVIEGSNMIFHSLTFPRSRGKC